MSISETQLQTWSHQGPIASSAETFTSIEHALNGYSWPDGMRRQVYLQGSYRNATNIRGDSDVDVVVQLDGVFYSNLTKEQKRQRGLSAGRYGFSDFRAEVLRALSDYFGCFAVDEGNKSLKVTSRRLRLSADAIPCAQYRYYLDPDNNDTYVEGMCFWTEEDSRCVINYPKVHYENGVHKHQRTYDRYKGTVRMFKNARNRLVDCGEIDEDIAPSYFLECFIYNVPDSAFVNSLQDTYLATVDWLSRADLPCLQCQNERVRLFGDTPEQWTAEYARESAIALAWLWENF